MRLPYITVVLLLLMIHSCQRELSFENGPSSDGYLEKDLAGNCLPVSVNGTYAAGHAANDTNYIVVSAHVGTPGNYTIHTDTVNGYSFKASGNFTDTGSVMVKLNCHGKPRVAGNDHFTIFYKASTCEVNIPVADSAAHAVFTLQGSPNACTNATVAGSYVKSIALDTSCKVKININVTTPGSYTISTNSVNGYRFTASGILTATGNQTVYLTASGAPVNNGTDAFNVNGGPTSCTFPVTVLASVITVNNDHFPLTRNSHWTYDDLHNLPGDSLKRTSMDTTLKDGNLYRVFNEDTRFWGTLVYFFRKTGNEYFEYARADKYTNSFQYANPIYTDLPFLKEGLTTGQTWSSQEYRDMASFGQVILLTYDYVCVNANATVVLNGRAFSDVYIVTMRPKISSVGNAYGYTGELYTYYYAKGAGMIYLEQVTQQNPQAKLQIRNWTVF